MQVDEHLSDYQAFIVGNGNSPNVCAMYFKRVRTFLGMHPEAMNASEQDLRVIIDGYIESLPVTSGKEVTATAVRYYWTMRFGKQYFTRFDPRRYPENPAIEQECHKFEQHLVKDGHLSGVTVTQRVSKVRKYLYIMFGATAFDRSMVDLASVMSYLSEAIAYTSASTKRGFCTEIRSYAVFLCLNGYDDTAGPITKVSLKGPEPVDALPKCISGTDYDTILASVDQGSPRGMRDLAMFLLMGNLGLRCSDVALLTLDDVDWANGILHITNSKSISDRSIPLDADTGGALEGYVLNGRPTNTGSRYIFLPCGLEERGERMGFSQVGQAINLLAQKSGVRFSGTHMLRHSVASNMVAGGAPVKTVADLLGHESLETTMRYLRIDIAGLRKAASSWPTEVAR